MIFRMQWFLLVTVLGLSTISMGQQRSRVGSLTGKLILEWSPGAPGFSLQTPQKIYSLDVKTNDNTYSKLVDTAKHLGKKGAPVAVNGYFEQRGQSKIFVVYNIIDMSPNAPTKAMVKQVQDKILQEFLPQQITNGAGVTIVLGRLSVVIFFENSAKFKQYVAIRNSQNKSPYYELVATSRGYIKVPLKLEKIGTIVPDPVGGVSN